MERRHGRRAPPIVPCRLAVVGRPGDNMRNHYMTYRVGSRSGRSGKYIERAQHAVRLKDEVLAVAEAQTLHHRTRPRIARLGVGHNLIGSQLIKGEGQAGTADLGRIAMAPARAEERPPDLEPVF